MLLLRGRSILQRSVEAFLATPGIGEVVVALPPELAEHPPACLVEGPDRGRVRIVQGGERRQDSVANAFARVSSRADVVVVHDAARPLVSRALIEHTVAVAAETGAAIAAIRAGDTVKRAAAGRILETLRRDEIVLAQTPQAFRVDVLRDALASGVEATDEAALAERAGHTVHVVDGDPRNIKITTPEDLAIAEYLLDGGSHEPGLRIGHGYDLHRLVAGGPLLLAGVTIPFAKGLSGHSDADAVCHAVTDAILGACGAGDIGGHFPDTDPAWKGADSLQLLARAVAIVRARGFSVVNVDVVVIAERPKILPHVPTMIANVAEALAVDASRVSIKGKTNEGVDAIGAGDAIAVHAVALLAWSP
jgi:2-C-methyl-D-erythritol 4-phosphate cytidylyltransferase/2-C-methyl-D-erythritol 2,4-cyclodiphosphate synthase